MELQGSVAVVTGASSGIGWSIAWALAREGADVVVAARRENRLARLVGEIEKRGRRALAVRCDVSDRADVERLRSEVEREFGRADVLVNNAGISGGGWFENISLDRIDAVVRTNLLGVMYGAKVFLPMMLEKSHGHIVNVASLAGRYATPGGSVYTATKHGVVAFTEALYYELKPRGVLATAVNPGLVETEGFRQPKELSWAVMEPSRIARGIVDVVRKGKAPEVSIPRWLAPMQAFRVLTPPLYRFGVRRMVGDRMATNQGE